MALPPRTTLNTKTLEQLLLAVDQVSKIPFSKAMAIRGIIGAFSKNRSQDLISDKDLMDWYDNIHIPDVIATSGQKTALRFQSLEANPEYPWLVVYPVKDILFSETEEFDKIPKGGHKELGYREFTDLADLDLRISERVSIFEAPNAKAGRSKYLLAESISAPEDLDEKYNNWFDVYSKLLVALPNFRRATRYVLYRSLSESSARHLVLYEFDTREIPETRIEKFRAEAGASEVLGSNVKFEAVPYELVKEAGILDEAL